MFLYLNTAPKANAKKDGGVFHTVLVGVSKEVLAEKTGISQSDLKDLNLKVTMEVFPEKVDLYTRAFKKAQAKGAKLVLKCDEIIVTELKPNDYTTLDGNLVKGMQCSVWADGESQLQIKRGSFTVSAELAELLEDDEDTL